jgi:hypothetical protein
VQPRYEGCMAAFKPLLVLLDKGMFRATDMLLTSNPQHTLILFQMGCWLDQ